MSVCFEVIDTGIGLSEAARKLLFSRLFRVMVPRHVNMVAPV